MTELDRPLDVDADLTLAVGDETVTIRGYGDLVVVAAPSLSVVRTLAGTAAPPFDVHLLDHLSDADVTLDVRVRGRSVARAGSEVDAGPLSRALGVAPARVSLGGLLLTTLGEWRC